MKRTYPIFLAHQLAQCRPGDPRLPLLNGLYIDMLPIDKLRVLAELHEIRKARRGEVEATINERERQ